MLSHPVESVVKSHGECKWGLSTSDHSEEKKADEVT